jgi:asparagine synthetase B (glutamine-hydrolysing)
VILIDARRARRDSAAEESPGEPSFAMGGEAPAGGGDRSVWRLDGPEGSITITSDEADVHCFELAGGTAVVVGRIRELVDVCTPEMDHARSPERLSGLPIHDATRLLTISNGYYLALVLRRGAAAGDAPAAPSVTLVRSWIPPRAIFFGATDGRAAAGTSPQLVSDALGFGRRLDSESAFDVCFNRNLVDDRTLFAGVRRLYKDEYLEILPGRVTPHRMQPPYPDMRELTFGASPERIYFDLCRAFVRRAVGLLVRDEPRMPIALLLSGGLDSRALMAVAREVGAENILGISIGRRRGFDESEIAAEHARRLGYPCARFFEEDLDFRGLLESYVVECASPPKYYNHLALESALREIGHRGGQLWTGDVIPFETAVQSIFAEAVRPKPFWFPRPGFWRLFAPLYPMLPRRARARLWVNQLTPHDACVVNLSSERKLADARAALRLFGRSARPCAILPHRSEAAERAIARLPAPLAAHRRIAWVDVIFAAVTRSRQLLARRIGARLEFPFNDIALLALGQNIVTRLPPPYRNSREYKKRLYEPWVPTHRELPNRGLVGNLPAWFRDPRKLQPYVDVITSRRCLERGIFDRREVQRLVARLDRLEPHEARMLWTVLTTELLFELDVLRVGETS